MEAAKTAETYPTHMQQGRDQAPAKSRLMTWRAGEGRDQTARPWEAAQVPPPSLEAARPGRRGLALARSGAGACGGRLIAAAGLCALLRDQHSVLLCPNRRSRARFSPTVFRT